MRLRWYYDWSRRHPIVLDGGIVLLFLVPSVLGTASEGGWLRAGLAIGLVAPLLWRRRRPVRVFTAISLACAVQVAVIDEPLMADFGFLFALYALAAYCDRRWVRVAGLGVGILGALLATLRWYQVVPPSLATVLPLVLIVIVTWMAGDMMRTRRAYVGELEERARRLELERDQQARIARSAERARIAREMHDVVAHSLSIMIAQADGGRYAAETDPDAAKDALDTIGQTGRRASTEMRRLLGVLKTESAREDAAAEASGSAGPDVPAVSGGAHEGAHEGAQYAPQPGVDRLPYLIEDLRTGGLPCTLSLHGLAESATDGDGEGLPDGAGLPEGMSLAAYRVVQEALTNALKHGGAGVSASVRVSRDADRLLIEVLDDGRGAAATGDGAGHGLTGMGERVGLFGGQLRTGPRTGGGFRVWAEIPIVVSAPTAVR